MNAQTKIQCKKSNKEHQQQENEHGKSNQLKTSVEVRLARPQNCGSELCLLWLADFLRAQLVFME